MPQPDPDRLLWRQADLNIEKPRPEDKTPPTHIRGYVGVYGTPVWV